jgi:hypothetical protein
VYSGALSECTGPWFGGPYSAGPQSCRDVGPMRFDLGDRTAVVDYTVDGVRVSKQVQRFTFRRTNLRGRFEGSIVQPAAGTEPERRQDDWTFDIVENGTSFTMSASSDSLGSCDYVGTPVQDGQFEIVAGTYRCNAGSRGGAWSMRVDPTTEGFSGTFNGDGFTSGRVAAAGDVRTSRMQGSGWRNDMWFVPAESGWGLNVIEQGNTLFATLFVYDAQRRPRWYVASELTETDQGDFSEGRTVYSGALFESTGPYFGTAFNPSAVARREVGRMSFQIQSDGTAELAYTVDGMQVTKQVQRFAFRKQSFTGNYVGSYAHDRQAVVIIDDDGPEFRMRLVDRFGGLGTCDFVAPFVQDGSLRRMAGTYSCGSRSGGFVMLNATVSAHGFTARFNSPLLDVNSIPGHIAGVRR